MKFSIAISGMNAGESPQPGPALARSLRDCENFSGKIVGLLYDAMESGIYSDGLIDAAFVVPYPSSGSDALLSRLELIHKKVPFEVLIPTLDAELPAYIRLEPKLREMGIRTFLPTERQLEARSKARLAEMGHDLGIPVPRQQLVTSLDMVPVYFGAWGHEAVVKGAYYEAGIAHNPIEASKIAAKISAKWGLPIIMQERIIGEEYDLALVGDGEGGTTGAVAIKKMALTEKGKAFSGMTISDEKLFALGETFISKTKWRGPLELEFVKSSIDNNYYLIEINPRFPAWIYLASRVGQNLPWAVARMALGERVPPFAAYKPGAFFVRHAIDIVSEISQLERLAVEGELILR